MSNTRLLVIALVLVVVVGGVLVAVLASGDDGPDGTPEASKTAPPPPRPTKGPQPGSRRFYRQATVRPVLDALEARVGGGGRLLDASLSPSRVGFTVAAGARGQLYVGKRPRYAKLGRGGSRELRAAYVRAASFSLSTLDPAVPESLVEAVRAKARKFRPTSITLKRDAYGELEWTIMGTARKRSVAYVADPDGSGLRPQAVELRRDAKLARRRRLRPLPAPLEIPESVRRKRVERARQIERCLKKAGQDRDKIEQCAEPAQ